MISEIKTCSGCGEVKPVGDFHRHRDTPDGLAYQCKACSAERSRAKYERDRDKILERNRIWREANRERDLESKRARYLRNREEASKQGRANRLKQYGLTEADFDALLESQGGNCAICQREPSSRPHVDHDHDTGNVRGLLCGPCNRGIGYLGDSPDVVRRALEYLDSSLTTGERP